MIVLLYLLVYLVVDQPGVGGDPPGPEVEHGHNPSQPHNRQGAPAKPHL